MRKDQTANIDHNYLNFAIFCTVFPERNAWIDAVSGLFIVGIILSWFALNILQCAWWWKKIEYEKAYQYALALISISGR